MLSINDNTLDFIAGLIVTMTTVPERMQWRDWCSGWLRLKLKMRRSYELKRKSKMGKEKCLVHFHTYAFNRDGAAFNVKTSDNRRCVNQNTANHGVMRDSRTVKAECHVIDDWAISAETGRELHSDLSELWHDD